MAITIHKKLGPSDYVLRSEQDAPNPATFSLRPLTDLELMDARAEMKIVPGEAFILTGTGTRRLLRNALLGWTGVRDEAGKAIPFSAEAIEALPGDVLTELAWEVLMRSTLTDEEKKTSASPSP